MEALQSFGSYKLTNGKNFKIQNQELYKDTSMINVQYDKPFKADTHLTPAIHRALHGLVPAEQQGRAGQPDFRQGLQPPTDL